MPTATATKTKRQTEVETKEDVEVVVDTKLNQIVEKWDKSASAADQGWLQVAKYVVDKGTTAAQLKQALIEIRGMKPTSAAVETSRFMRFTKSEEAKEMLERALEGDEDITVRDLRSANVLKGEKAEKDPQEQVEKKLLAVAKFAILNAEVDDLTEFLSQCRRAFKLAHASAMRAQSRASNGEEAEEEDEEETED